MFTLIFAIAYYAFLVFRPMGGSSGRFRAPAGSYPALLPQNVDAGVFGFFTLLSLLLMISIMTPRGGFRQSDVDVLFPTPISPRLVMFFRMARDYVFTLLTPLIFMLFGGRASWEAVQGFLAGMHGNAQLVSRVSAIAWFLMSFSWVCVGYGVGFLVNRSDLTADVNKKRINVLLLIVIIGTALYFLMSLRADLSWETVSSCVQSAWVRIVFFTATAATWMVMGAYSGEPIWIGLGIGLLIAVATLGIYVANSQLPYMYDQAAVRGFGSAEQRVMRRNNDIYGLTAQRARDGKIKVGRLSRWVGRMRLSGASALVWKEVLLQLRGARFLYFFFGPVQLFLTLSPIFVLPANASPSQIKIAGSMIIVMQCVSVLMLTMNSAISGFTELLKRVDFQKPLPFRPAGTVFWEVASKCIPNVLFAGISCLILVAVRPMIWDYGMASFVFVVGLSLLVSATVFLVTIAFPDAGDASQRGFRGILIMLGMVILGLPGVGAFIVLFKLLDLNPVVAVIPSAVINFGVALVVSFFAGGLYDSYNPSE